MRFIIGCDFHPSYQQIAMLDTQTGEVVEKSLAHEHKEEVKNFYAGLPGPARVGIEATGQSQWFERLLVELKHEMWIGDAARIRASEQRKQKTDRQPACLAFRYMRNSRMQFAVRATRACAAVAACSAHFVKAERSAVRSSADFVSRCHPEASEVCDPVRVAVERSESRDLSSIRHPRRVLRWALFAFAAAIFVSTLGHAQTKSTNAKKLPRVRQLDQHITFERDSSTGELRVALSGEGASGVSGVSGERGNHPIEVVTQMVAVTCSVFTAEGDPVPGLVRSDFRIYDNGVEQRIAYFDASTQPASVVLIIDASPSVLRDTDEMKRAASALVDALAPLDQAAVADFSAHTYLQLPFSDVRELIRRAVARVDPRQLLGDTGGSNIYEAVYLVAHDLFSGRTGRKSIVLLTDGQDSGLGLTLDPATASPRAGFAENRLTFDDVSRLLASEDIQLFAVSTEPRPKIMTPDWLAAHAGATLLTSASRRENIPPDTLYLAELVRRAGGQLYFLRDKETLADTFRDIAGKIRAEYTLGFYPATASASAPASAAPSAAAGGWHQLRVDLPAQADARASYRSSYYVSP